MFHASRTLNKPLAGLCLSEPCYDANTGQHCVLPAAQEKVPSCSLCLSSWSSNPEFTLQPNGSLPDITSASNGVFRKPSHEPTPATCPASSRPYPLAHGVTELSVTELSHYQRRTVLQSPPLRPSQCLCLSTSLHPSPPPIYVTSIDPPVLNLIIHRLCVCLCVGWGCPCPIG